MNAVINKLAEMVIMIMIGYLCAKVKLSGPEFNKHTSAVLTNVLLPATILKSMTGIHSGVNNGEVVYVILLFFLMMGIAGLVGKIVSRVLSLAEDERGIMLCLIMYMNISFVGFPLVETYYGSEGMFYACLSCVPMNILMFSAGVATISGNKSNGINLKQLFNIPLIATIIGVVIMVLNVPIPNVISSTISSLAGATIPVSMIILGSSLAAIPFVSTVSDYRIYIASFARLVICPVATNLLLRLFVDNEMLIGTVTILASTPVAVLMTPLCVQYGKSDELSSKSIFMSTVISIITMPVIIWALL